MIKWTICAQIIWLFCHFDCSILGNKEKSFKIIIIKLRLNEQVCAQIIWLFSKFDWFVFGNKLKSFKISITRLRPMSYVWLYSVNVMLCLYDAFVIWWCDWWFSCIYPINQNSILYLSLSVQTIYFPYPIPHFSSYCSS